MFSFKENYACPKCKSHSEHCYCPDCGTKTLYTGQGRYKMVTDDINHRFTCSIMTSARNILKEAELTNAKPWLDPPLLTAIHSLALKCVREATKYDPFDIKDGVIVVKPDAVDVYRRMTDQAHELFELAYAWLLVNSILNPISKPEGEQDV